MKKYKKGTRSLKTYKQGIQEVYVPPVPGNEMIYEGALAGATFGGNLGMGINDSFLGSGGKSNSGNGDKKNSLSNLFGGTGLAAMASNPLSLGLGLAGAGIGALAGKNMRDSLKATSLSRQITNNTANRLSNEYGGQELMQNKLVRNQPASFVGSTGMMLPNSQESMSYYAADGMANAPAAPIEVERNELIFRRNPNNPNAIKLVADFEKGRPHSKGGEPYVAQQGDIIFPGKLRDKLLKTVNKSNGLVEDVLKFQSEWEKLPTELENENGTMKAKKGTRSLRLPMYKLGVNNLFGNPFDTGDEKNKSPNNNIVGDGDVNQQINITGGVPVTSTSYSSDKGEKGTTTTYDNNWPKDYGEMNASGRFKTVLGRYTDAGYTDQNEIYKLITGGYLNPTKKAITTTTTGSGGAGSNSAAVVKDLTLNPTAYGGKSELNISGTDVFGAGKMAEYFSKHANGVPEGFENWDKHQQNLYLKNRGNKTDANGNPLQLQPYDFLNKYPGFGTDLLNMAAPFGDLFTKPEMTAFNRMTPEMLAYQDRSNPQRVQNNLTSLANASNIRNLAGGNATVTMANLANNNARSLRMRNEIENAEGIRADQINAANAQVKNAANQMNTEISNQEIIANEQNRARARDINREGLRQIIEGANQSLGHKLEYNRDVRQEAAQQEYLANMDKWNTMSIQAKREANMFGIAATIAASPEAAPFFKKFFAAYGLDPSILNDIQSGKVTDEGTITKTEQVMNEVNKAMGDAGANNVQANLVTNNSGITDLATQVYNQEQPGGNNVNSTGIGNSFPVNNNVNIPTNSGLGNAVPIPQGGINTKGVLGTNLGLTYPNSTGNIPAGNPLGEFNSDTGLTKGNVILNPDNGYGLAQTQNQSSFPTSQNIQNDMSSSYFSQIDNILQGFKPDAIEGVKNELNNQLAKYTEIYIKEKGVNPSPEILDAQANKFLQNLKQTLDEVPNIATLPQKKKGTRSLIKY